MVGARHGSRPIEEYALIGDGHTAALVALDGSIDGLCWLRFDSDACFAALLGDEAQGNWRIIPDLPCTMSRRYRGDTLVRDTEFTSDGNAIRLTDFMPLGNTGLGLCGSVLQRAG